MEEVNPFISFDWYFADYSEEDGARFRALKERAEQTVVLARLVQADSLTNFALWSELPEDHPVGELWPETQTDLLATIYLAYGGFFRQALATLRSWFEVSTHAVFFSGHYGQPTGRYEQWRKGQRNAPANMAVLADSLAAREDKNLPVDKETFRLKLCPIYEFLSRQTHAQGLDVCDLQEGRDNVPRYLPKSFDIWNSKVLEAFDSICFLYRVFFPKPVAAYLRGSGKELERMIELGDLLKGSLPGFGELVQEVLAVMKP